MTSRNNADDKLSLSTVQLFANVPLEPIRAFLRQCEERHVKAGEILLCPNDKNTHVYCLLSGHLSIHLDTVKNPPLNNLEPGECVGEMSIIDGHYPSAYVVAQEDSWLLAIAENTFWALIEASPQFNRNLLRILCRRMRYGGAVIIDKEQHANIDVLTSLPNRRALEKVFRQEQQRCIAREQPLCLMMVDIDHFKRFNDRHGHLAGDKALCLVAQLLNDHVRNGDIVARFGGEEFSILLPEAELQAALDVAERLRSIVSKTRVEITPDQALSPLTISLGIARMSANELLESLMANADKAL